MNEFSKRKCMLFLNLCIVALFAVNSTWCDDKKQTMLPTEVHIFPLVPNEEAIVGVLPSKSGNMIIARQPNPQKDQQGPYDATFLQEIDHNGHVLWNSSVKVSRDCLRFSSLSQGEDGGFCLVGWTNGASTIDFGGGVTFETRVNSENNLFIAYFDGNGKAKWAHGLLSPLGYDTGSYYFDSAIQSDGSILALGVLYGRGDFDFGQNHVVSTNKAQNIVVSYDDEGAINWISELGEGPDSITLSCISVARDGTILIGGSAATSGDYRFGSSEKITTPFQYGDNFVLIKCDAFGNPIWAKTVASAENFSQVVKVRSDREGNIYVVGEFGGGTFAFSPDVALDVYGADQGVLAKFSSEGEILWVRSVSLPPGEPEFPQKGDVAPSHGRTWFTDLMIDLKDNPIVSGFADGRGPLSFGAGFELPRNFGQSIGYLVKFNASGVPFGKYSLVAAKSVVHFQGLTLNEDGETILTGYLDRAQILFSGKRLVIEAQETAKPAGFVLRLVESRN